MGLTFKPSKCRSLSIKGGRVNSDCKFFLLAGNGEKAFLKTMEDDPHKFLGSTITHRNTPADHFAFLKEKLEEKLSNVDKTLVRGEYKMAISTAGTSSLHSSSTSRSTTSTRPIWTRWTTWPRSS